MKWRVIGLERRSAAENMAIDEMLVRTGQEPTIRFYQFTHQSVTLGRKQDHTIVMPGAIRTEDVVRRVSGGNAVYHGVNDLTYSVTAPLELLGGDKRAVYDTVRSWIVNALNSLEGVTVDSFGENDIVLNGKKVCGNAIFINQENKYVLVHGSVFVRSIPEQWAVSLDVPLNQFQSKLGRLANIIDQESAVEKTYEALQGTFLSNDIVSETYSRPYSGTEWSVVDDLLNRRYRNEAWRKDGSLEGTACATDIRDD